MRISWQGLYLGSADAILAEFQVLPCSQPVFLGWVVIDSLIAGFRIVGMSLCQANIVLSSVYDTAADTTAVYTLY